MREHCREGRRSRYRVSPFDAGDTCSSVVSEFSGTIVCKETGVSGLGNMPLNVERGSPKFRLRPWRALSLEIAAHPCRLCCQKHQSQVLCTLTPAGSIALHTPLGDIQTAYHTQDPAAVVEIALEVQLERRRRWKLVTFRCVLRTHITQLNRKQRPCLA